MVNDMKTKDLIFNILSEADEVISGEKISDLLGISRVSVWKHIKALVRDGIAVTSSSNGYLLTPDSDSLNPLGFGDWKDYIHYFKETTSTMDEALILARQGCPGFTIALAGRQTQGRGRMQRVWTSDDGGLFFTVVIRPEIPVSQASLVNLAAAVELNKLLRRSYGIEAHLKWPNDILVGTLKICGFLSQMESEGELVGYLSVGIGLNVNNDPNTNESRAVSMKNILGKTVPRKELLIDFLDTYRTRIESFDGAEIIREWKENNATIGRQVRVVTIQKTHEGKAVDIDKHGGLVLEKADGSRETVIHGDCFYRSQK